MPAAALSPPKDKWQGMGQGRGGEQVSRWLETSRDKRSSLEGVAINQSDRAALDICTCPLVGLRGSLSLRDDG